MRKEIRWMMMILVVGWVLPTPGLSADDDVAVDPTLSQSVRAELRLAKTTVPAGSPVYVEFLVRNITGKSITLSVPGTQKGKELLKYGMGLPLEHIFSGKNFQGLEVASEDNPNMGDRLTRKPQYPVPPVTLAPYASIGLRFDVSRFYPGLHQVGIYVLIWKPYGEMIATDAVLLKVVSFKQAVIETEFGNMTMRFLYDKAPRHVENFIELADQRFYQGKSFDTVFANQFILGGDSVGDGTGKRPDGIIMEPEFNDVPFELGTVGMALIESDVNSASCQFFICLADQPGWNGRYTAFARIEGPESLTTLRKLGQMATDDQHHPTKPIKIKRITIADAPFIPRQVE